MTFENRLELSEKLDLALQDISELRNLEEQRSLTQDEQNKLNELLSIIKALQSLSINPFKNAEQRKRYSSLIAGSFDPYTYGHHSMLKTALEKSREENIVIGIAVNSIKKPTFSPYDRKFIIESYLSDKDKGRVKVDIISGPTKIYMTKNAIPNLLRGARDQKDFADESTLARLNDRIPGKAITSIYPQTDDKLSAVSSSNLKLLADLGVPLDDYASAFTREVLKMKTSGKLLVGVIGGVASGKSSICRELEQYSKNQDINIHYINMDAYGHTILNATKDVLPMYEDVRDEVTKEFGPAVRNADGTINRAELRKIVFGNNEKLEKLNGIMFEPVMTLLIEDLMPIRDGIILLENAALVQQGLTEICDENILNVRVSPEVQLERLQNRNNLSRSEASDMIFSQFGQDETLYKINEKHAKEFDRMYVEVDTDCNISDISIQNVYDNLENEYLRRREVRRYGKLFIPEEIYFDDDLAFIQTIKEKYSEHHRYYHNLNHIEDMLVLFQKVKDEYKKSGGKLPYANEIYLATMFHDIIYNIKKDTKSNEVKSAEFAADYLKEHLKTPNIDIDVVCELIKLTESHTDPRHEAKELEEYQKIFLDMDMTIFAAEEDKLGTYENAIYQEYSSLYTRNIYIEGRRDVLWDLLEKRYIYHSNLFRKKYDKKAWKNVKSLINYLYKEEANLSKGA